MILTKPSFEILTKIDYVSMLKLIEQAGRVCYKSEDKITDDSAKKFVEMILKRGHESVIEHMSVTAKVICDRGVSHEIVRHRLASYSQESTRYCNYKGGVEFIIPCWCTNVVPQSITTVAHLNEDSGKVVSKDEELWASLMSSAESCYKRLIDMGWNPQQARSVLPNSLKTEIVMTANLREWRTVFKQRTPDSAHLQMREIMIPMLKNFKEKIPILFDDIKS